MSKVGLLIVLILMAGSNYAQDYFIFIQADNKLPFYVRLGSDVYSSTTGGHLILSQLKDSTYHLIIGMPGQSAQEQRYIVAVHQTDQAFRLKEQGEKGWSLYDEQTGEIKSPEVSSGRGDEIRPAGIKKDDAFSRLMAGVVYDTAVLYNTYAMEQVFPDSSRGTPVPNSSMMAATRQALPDSSITTTVRQALPDSSSTAPPLQTIDSSTAALSRQTIPDSSVTATIRQTVPDSSATATSRQAVSDSSTAVTNMPGISLSDPKPDASTGIKPSSRARSIVKLGERKLPHTLRLAYADHSTGKKADTIILFIPLDTFIIAKGSQRPPRTTVDTTRISTLRSSPTSRAFTPGSSPASRTSAPGSATISGSSTPGSSPTGAPNPGSSIPGASNPGSSLPGASNSISSTSGAPVTETPQSRPLDSAHRSATARSSLSFVNSDCHSYATDYDVDKLRVKMLDANKDEERIQIARKVFKTRCFSTRQIKALSEVFTTDAAKFRFLETAYPFCSDDRFRELSTLLADPVYSSKFHLMTDHP